MKTIEQLLAERTEIDKQITQLAGAEVRQSKFAAEFAAEVKRKKDGVLKFSLALAKMHDDKFIKILTDAGWVKDNPLSIDKDKLPGVWTKPGTSIKLKIDAGSWTATNGTEVSDPKPLDHLAAYVNQKAATTKPFAPGPLKPLTQPDIKK